MTETKDPSAGMSLLRALGIGGLALVWCCMELTVRCAGETSTADAASTQPPADPAIVVQVAQLRAADAATDLAAAWKANDRRYIAVMGVGVYIPGIDQATLGPDDGMRVIDHTSDCPRNDTEEALDDLAKAYATKYNTLLKQRLAMARAAAQRAADPPADPHRPVPQDSMSSRMP